MMNLKKYIDVKNILSLITLIVLFYNYLNFDKLCLTYYGYYDKVTSTVLTVNYSRYEPMIFVGGVPRSGTTLMRVMLDAHPLIRCGEETRILPTFVGQILSKFNLTWKQDNIDDDDFRNMILNQAISSFMLEIIVRHGKPAKYLCNKDPFLIKYSLELSKIFPNAKFILMIRDARASVHSIISRQVTIKGFDMNNYTEAFKKWNSYIERMYTPCMILGENNCLPVYYEQLVLHPEREMKKILKFVNVPWNDAVLNHEKYIGDEISLSKFEKSSDQVVKPVNLEALTSWIGKIPQDALNNIDVLAPMMKILGYDTKANRPNYGIADKKILDNTLNVQKNRDFWLKIAKNYSIHV